MAVKPVFVDGKLQCPAAGCGSYQFLATLLLDKPGHWRLESIFCCRCNTEIEATPEVEDYMRKKKWTVIKMNYERAQEIIQRIADEVEAGKRPLPKDELAALYKAHDALASCMGRGEEGEDW